MPNACALPDGIKEEGFCNDAAKLVTSSAMGEALRVGYALSPTSSHSWATSGAGGGATPVLRTMYSVHSSCQASKARQLGSWRRGAYNPYPEPSLAWR